MKKISVILGIAFVSVIVVWGCSQNDSLSPSTSSNYQSEVSTLSSTLTIGEQLGQDANFQAAVLMMYRIADEDPTLPSNSDEIFSGYMADVYSDYGLGSYSETDQLGHIQDGFDHLPPGYEPPASPSSCTEPQYSQCMDFSHAQFMAEIGLLGDVDTPAKKLEYVAARNRYYERNDLCDDTFC